FAILGYLRVDPFFFSFANLEFGLKLAQLCGQVLIDRVRYHDRRGLRSCLFSELDEVLRGNFLLQSLELCFGALDIGVAARVLGRQHSIVQFFFAITLHQRVLTNVPLLLGVSWGISGGVSESNRSRFSRSVAERSSDSPLACF